MSAQTENPRRSAGASARVGVQRFGTFLSGMVMPNIGAFIAWGLITALFIEKGPFPWPEVGGFGTHMVDGKEVPWTGIVGPMITYLLPILIGFTGGKMMHGHRGGVVGAIATMGVIAGASVPMFIGAMIMGPLGGWTMKKIDSIWDGKIKPGFEMLVNNFSAGIWGLILALIGMKGVSVLVVAFTSALSKGLDALVSSGLLPLTALVIEPAKVLFLNNALNHGILTPLGTEQVQQSGKSILFLLEANPGPGLGVLLAYMLFGRGAAKSSAFGAGLIHFFGGIHEIYFPYVLMKPQLILATIGGSMAGIATLSIFKDGLVGPAAPGSIIAVLGMGAPGDRLTIILAVLIATLVSFVISAFILRFSKDKGEGDLSTATSRMEEMKGKKSSVASTLTGAGAGAAASGPINRIVFACDAGMGSSAMGASVLRNKIKAAGHPEVSVTNSAIANLKDEWDLVVVHQDLADRAASRVPSARLVTVDNFMNSPRYDEIVETVDAQSGAGTETQASAPAASGAAAAVVAPSSSTTTEPAAAQPRRAVDEDGDARILGLDSIVLQGRASNQAEAIDEAGRMLVDAGAVDPSYIPAMHEREASVPTYMGNFLAIPHGTNEAKGLINSSALSFVRYPTGLDWNGKEVKFVVGIAGKGKDHLSILSRIAKVFSDKTAVAQLEAARTREDILAILGKVNS
ncbi:PTS mannitol transporter subunit IICBA [Falsarthrobacter nasiphocae]|uniref:Mannitol-specific phosphotransferase enzyme IIA component n=1 Tax=Falsarthrobacter nasiphocae TaxID=189863 RepID=A0AAE4C7C7_9MICC|nr:PTS mannitol transporter subunit IICBA [Falsarthrobacter nasiphocae]MDR6892419.1 PTS system mannitol-specific IIC component [Falsarthrobacter nasiphocae]